MSAGGQKPISVVIVGFNDESRESIAHATEELGFRPQNFLAADLVQPNGPDPIEKADVLLVQKKAIAQHLLSSNFQETLLKRRSSGKFNGLFDLQENMTLPNKQNRLFHSFLCVRSHNKKEQKKALLSFFENVRFFLGQRQL